MIDVSDSFAVVLAVRLRHSSDCTPAFEYAGKEPIKHTRRELQSANECVSRWVLFRGNQQSYESVLQELEQYLSCNSDAIAKIGSRFDRRLSITVYGKTAKGFVAFQPPLVASLGTLGINVEVVFYATG